jgi:hypothetical protein
MTKETDPGVERSYRDPGRGVGGFRSYDEITFLPHHGR